MRKVFYILGQLSDSDIEWIVGNGRKREIPSGTMVIQEGKEIDILYIVLSGVLEVTGSYLSGPPVRLGSGEIVGEVSLLDSRPPIATVTAAEASVVLAIPRSLLLDKLRSDTSFAAHFYRALAVLLAHRLRNTGRHLTLGTTQKLDDDAQYDDELSPELLDEVHLAGRRFDEILQRLKSK